MQYSKCPVYNPKLFSISHASKVMLEILLARFQQYINHEHPDVQAGFRKDRGTRDQIANICWIIEKARKFQKKHLLLLHWLHQSLWLCRSQQTMENSERDGNTRPPYLPPEKPVCRSRSNSWNRTWNNELVQNSERSTSRLYFCHPAYLTYMQNTSWEMPSWMNHKLESRLLGEYRCWICRWYQFNGRKRRGTKEPLEGERGEWKSWFKSQHLKKLRSQHPVPSLHG